MPLISAFWGFVILVAGRQYYPIFVGGVFYVASTFIIEQVWAPLQGIQTIWVPLVFGLLGWGLTLELRRWIARPAIFAAGYYVFLTLLPVLGVPVALHWIILVLCGLIFFILSLLWFDYTLMSVAVLTGSTMILSAANFPVGLSQGVFALCVFFSFAAQLVIRRYGDPIPD